MAQQRIAQGIHRALAERPSRLTHGYTAKNAFWIDTSGNIIQYNEIGLALHTGDAISVHSHLPEHFWRVPQLHEQTFNAGDLSAMKWQIRHNCGNKAAVLTSLDTYDYIEIPPKAQQQFLKLGQKRLSDLAEAKYGEAEHLGVGSYEADRIKLRKFADDYGLIYKEDQGWVVPPGVLKERML